MAFELAQVVAKLVKTVGFFRKMEALENDLMNLLGGPAAEVIASMQKNLQEPDGAGLMDHLWPSLNCMPLLNGLNSITYDTSICT